MLKALLISNMRASPQRPERGSFVRDQAAALAELPGVQVELHEFQPGARALVAAAPELRHRYAGRSFDVVHAHFGLTAWPALAIRAGIHAVTFHGTDLAHPRTRMLSRLVLPLIDLPATASAALLPALPSARARQRAAVLPCGVQLARFAPQARQAARAKLGLHTDCRYLLFPADPGRTEKRFDRAIALREAFPQDQRPELLSLRGIAPAEVADWINSADAVLVPSEREGFGLAAIEALACDVPVLASPVGIHPEALANLDGTLCERFDPQRWRDFLLKLWQAGDGRIRGRARAERYSVERMAGQVLIAWQQALRAKGVETA